MIRLIRRLALPVAITSIIVNTVMLIVSLIIWWLAIVNDWLDKVEFVSHVSMLALVFSAVSGVAAAVAGVLALVPTDDLLEDEPVSLLRSRNPLYGCVITPIQGVLRRAPPKEPPQ